MFAVRKAMMGGGVRDPEFVSATTALSGTAVSSISVPATTGAVGQLEVVAIFNNGTAAVTPPPGWTEVFDTGAATPDIALYWRNVTGDDAAAQVFTMSVAVNRIAYIQARYKNAAFDAASVGVVAATTNPAIAPTITAKKGLVGVLAAIGSGSTSSWTTPSGMTDIIKGTNTVLSPSLFQREHSSGTTGTTSVINTFSTPKRAATFSIKGK